ncbi:ABC transporter permease [Bremerella alba]|uniref:Riboflavin transport system permease protein RibX n=1 Tax=Bremerella alba TaxID=980252 RepID=A0A7V8V7T3_9BACT|nr:ABC transporter permease [Bremerella alba]MBA2116261.1 Riboflavin transport system permease protein RibX [Bremerella alba]
MSEDRFSWRTIVLPLLVLVLTIGLWQGLILVSGLEPYILPGPWDVGKTMWLRGGSLFLYSLRTGLVAISGFLISVLLGVSVSLLFSQSAIIRQSGYPYAIFFQTVPIVAVAPLVIAIFGYGVLSVIVVTTMISLFPIITSTTTGLITVDRGLLDLFRLNNATRWQVLWKLQFPGAIRYLLTGMKTSAGLAVVGAIVGEFFAGHSSGHQGLGYFILVSQNQINTTSLFAGTICSTLLGVVVFATISLLSRLLLRRWVGEGSP